MHTGRQKCSGDPHSKFPVQGLHGAFLRHACATSLSRQQQDYQSMSLPTLFTYLLLHSVLLIKVSSALNLPPIQTLGGQIPGNGGFSGNVSSPTSILSLVASRPMFQCIGGAEYGDSIRLESCRDAASRLLASAGSQRQRILSFINRNIQAAVGEADVILPYISLSRMDFS